MTVKIAAIGAGSFVFGPSVLAQTFLEYEINDVHLALVDPDMETIELMAGVGRRMAQERGLRATITAHADRDEALDGAGFVICSASPQMKARFQTDWRIIDEYAPGHLKTEFGGVAGISYSLRQIALIRAITDDMKRLCPNSWLLNVSNPLPRVAQAASENGIQTAGFCAVSLSAYGTLWRLLTGEHLPYPWEPARARWQLTSAGLNHFAWVVGLEDRVTGENLLPQVRERLAAGGTTGQPRADALARETGFLLSSGDDHTRDFLPPAGPDPGADVAPFHGNADERRRRLELLSAVGEGRASWDDLLAGEAWEKPLAFVSALSGGPAADFHSLNLLNGEGQVANLPRNVFVETPCRVSAEGVQPKSVTLPESVVPLCERTAQVTDTLVRAAREHSRALVHEAIELDPTVLDKAAGVRAVDACLVAQKDLVGEYR